MADVLAVGLDAIKAARLAVNLVVETAGSMVAMLGWKMVACWAVR